MLTIWAKSFMIASHQPEGASTRWDAPSHWRRSEKVLASNMRARRALTDTVRSAPMSAQELAGAQKAKSPA